MNLIARHDCRLSAVRSWWLRQRGRTRGHERDNGSTRSDHGSPVLWSPGFLVTEFQMTWLVSLHRSRSMRTWLTIKLRGSEEQKKKEKSGEYIRSRTARASLMTICPPSTGIQCMNRLILELSRMSGTRGVSSPLQSASLGHAGNGAFPLAAKRPPPVKQRPPPKSLRCFSNSHSFHLVCLSAGRCGTCSPSLNVNQTKFAMTQLKEVKLIQSSRQSTRLV
jgi:hypothetical protein